MSRFTNCVSLKSVPIDILNIIIYYANVSKIEGRYLGVLSKKHNFSKIWSMSIVDGGGEGIRRNDDGERIRENRNDGVILSSYNTGNIQYVSGNNDPIVNIADLSNPCQVTVASFIIYVAGFESHVVRLYTLGGAFIRNIGENHLSFPCGVAVSPFSGEIFVSEYGNNRITVFSSSGQLLRQWGQFGHDAGKFHFPKHVVYNRDKIYVVDFYNNRIQVFLPSGEFLFAFGKLGNGPTQFSGPTCLALSAFNEIIVTDKNNKRIQFFNENGVFLRYIPTITRPVCIAVNRFGHLLLNSYKNVFIFE